MQSLGTRVVPEDTTLRDRIANRLHNELDDQARAGMLVMSDRGLGLFRDDGADGSCLLSVDDVARIAAAEALGMVSGQADS